MNPLKRRANSNDLIVLWETAVKPDLEMEIEKLFGGDAGIALPMTKVDKKELLTAFLDMAGARVATLAIMDARGIAKNKSVALQKI